MKKILLLLLVLPVCIFAQQRDVFRIDSLPKEGVVLNKGWRWHTGDDPDFAKSNFDDSQWESIDPSQKVSSMPVIPKGINWFRLQAGNGLGLEFGLRYCGEGTWREFGSRKYGKGRNKIYYPVAG